MRRYEACLIDVFETVLSCDFAAHVVEMPAMAGVDAEVWNAAFARLGPAVTDGRLSLFDAYADIVRRSGVEPGRDHVEALVRRDWELLLENSRVHDDTVPFLEALRRKGIRTAFVSNCAENAGSLLDSLGLTPLVDEVVLSCEVGAAKPDPPIYEVALDRLGMTAGTCLFVDDQVAYCDGALALGIDAVRIHRGGSVTVGDELLTVSALTDLEDRF